MNWNNVATDESPEGTAVMTMSDGGIEQILIRRKRLWFVSDGSMYVYYVPKHWRPLSEAEKTSVVKQLIKDNESKRDDLSRHVASAYH